METPSWVDQGHSSAAWDVGVADGHDIETTLEQANHSLCG